ncbi:tRNA glutamyl-Q(34) synthetase GluQRS [Vibrio sp. SCSIO 43136]|uniref:tRNA glutamyl-Q(34) synthetase GluQRS n=1 Tax=Vibrio sp. SCSIO 43136 TaxID=2819101 RepID=UPI0020755960|nr:tRNA glutamyl-Q(34) synthetase GluQRS [Vibrio sp. SCSIO 43136]USD64817.1 tRNA glutamyl-Q(34) synthetase GluQRS [Vibrio sp. SCSIO 43136]
MTITAKPYIGRFAPSPSGPLHFGSLVAALGSYFQAKANQGQWLVRIEDLDPPREMPGASALILETLEKFGLEWDGDVVYQSQRHERYQAQIEQWLEQGLAYYCQCTRKQIKAQGGFYTGTCRTKQLTDDGQCAVRLVMQHPITEFLDQKHGRFTIPESLAGEDFIIKRRDGLYAYNLAVVLDDIDQGVTEVVRGADLIEPTGRQISLYKMLNKAPVSYLHLPLAMDNNGNKLSKQNHATGINLDDPKPEIVAAMSFLNFDLPDNFEDSSISEMIDWGARNWTLNQLPSEINITPAFSNQTS